ncbi:MAG: hypothetical protein ACRER0_00140 [Gammaproteobacteria bacterium]
MKITGGQNLPKLTAAHKKWGITALSDKASTNLSTDNVDKEVLRKAELVRCKDVLYEITQSVPSQNFIGPRW